MEAYEGADWVRISDEVPIDEDGRDRAPRGLPDPLPPRLDRLGLRNRARTGRRGARRGRGRPGARPRGLSASLLERGQGARLHAARPGRQQGQAHRPARARPSSSTSTPAPTPRAARPRPAASATAAPSTASRARGCSAISPDEAGGADEVRRQVRPRLHPARRRRPRGRRGVRRLGREVDVRQEVHGHAARDLHHRPRRARSPRSSPRCSRKSTTRSCSKALAEL